MALLSLQASLLLSLAAILAWVLNHVRQHWRYYYLVLLIPNNNSRFLFFGLPFLGLPMEEVTKQFIKLFDKSREFPLFKIWLGPHFLVFPTDPDAINKILVDHLDKPPAAYEKISGTSGQGLIQHTHLPRWRKHRKIIGTSFQYSALQSYIQGFFQEATILADKMAHLAISKEPFEPNHLVGLAALNGLMRSTFGVDFEIQQNYSSHHPYVEAVDSAFEIFHLRFWKPWLLINFFYNMSVYKSKNSKNRAIQREFITSVMDRIRSDLEDSSTESMSFAKRVLRNNTESTDPLNREMSDKELLREMVSLLNAGFDTLMITISLVLNILAIHQNIQQEVFRELENVFGEDDAAPSYDQLQKLDLLTRVIKEVMRLYPAGPLICRTSPTELQCGDYIVPSGALITIFIYGIHRDPRHWPHPDRFDPDRFLPSEVAKRNPNAYLPFSLGKRNCIGSKYAMLQMKSMISTLLMRYRILPGDKCRSMGDIRFLFGMTIKLLPGNDIRIEARKRCSRS